MLDKIKVFFGGVVLGFLLDANFSKNGALNSVINGVVQLLDKPLIKSHGMWILAMVLLILFSGWVVRGAFESAVKMSESAHQK